MIIEKYKRTFLFYCLSLVFPWLFWFIAAYLSHRPNPDNAIIVSQAMLGILGLIAPVIVAAAFFRADPELLKDLQERFFRLRSFPIIYLFFSLFLIFGSIILGQLISVFFGHSLNQFVISGRPSFYSALLSPWFILIFAPIVEELAWHSYGTDALRRKHNLFNTCIIFSIYWVIWHLPLSFINGYYHSNIVAEGWIYSLNFVFSLFVFVILMNWLYYKTGRNILIAIIFHLSANISNEIFATHPDSKVIQTILLLVFSIVILFKERKMFFSKTDFVI